MEKIGAVQQPEKSVLTFANVAKKQTQKKPANNKSVAMKPTEPIVHKQCIVIDSQNDQTDITIQKENKMETSNWTVVNKKKRYPNDEVKKGESTNSTEIKGSERKRYLHVWRLDTETTIESLQKYVKNICGNEVPIKTDQIKHKNQRDYSSFIIALPESKYNVLCQPEHWPINIEFCEWVWFRRNTHEQQSDKK